MTTIEPVIPAGATEDGRAFKVPMPSIRCAGNPSRSACAMVFHVYIMASGPRGTLYVGITNNLGKRIVEHREGRGSRFVWQYKVFRLVYAEAFDDPRDAIAAEKRIKKWRRAWKIALVEKSNPEWQDLSQFVH
jgi:putative endonuclease